MLLIWRVVLQLLPRLRIQSGGKDHATCFSSPGALEQCNETAPFCSKGHIGVKCGVCMKGYYATTGGACERCDGNASRNLVALTSSIVVLVIAFVLFMLFGGGSLHHALKTKLVVYYPIIFDMAKFKIVWSTWQIIVSVDWSLEINFPEPFVTLKRMMAIVSLSLNQVFPMGCYVTYRHCKCFTIMTI